MAVHGSYFFVTLLISLIYTERTSCEALSMSDRPSRRQWMLQGAQVAASLIIAPTWAEAHALVAVRGAAELDLEYYARDLLGGNRKEGTVLPSSKIPPVPPPRTIEQPLRSMFMSEFDSSEDSQQDSSSIVSIPESVLMDMVARIAPSKGNKKDQAAVLSQIRDRARDYRDKSKRSFAARAQWSQESISDQYYFDLSCYAFWRTAADLLPNYVDRDVFMREIGRQALAKCQSLDLLPSKALPTLSLTAALPRIFQLLTLFRSLGMIESYYVGDNNQSKNSDFALFDEVDNRALQEGAPVDLIVRLIQPATLGSSLQLTGEQTRFAPDFVGPTVAAILENIGVQCSWESFFVDNEYRPNPKDYFPNEQLLQFTLSRR